MTALFGKKYGSAFRLRLPLFGDCVVISDPTLAKQLFTTSGDTIANIHPNLGRILGRGSMFSLEGREHRARRKLLTPPLHGRRIKGYEQIVEEEFLAESASWPENTPMRSLEPMMRITLNAILRTVFGARGADLDSLREIIPPMVEVGSRLAVIPDLPIPPDFPIPLGPLNPRRAFEDRRRQYFEIVDGLIDEARNDPDLADRDDILALMVMSRYDDGQGGEGEPMSDQDIADELITLLVAGHETTATTLAWMFERLSRNPESLARLVADSDAGTDPETDVGADYRHATILETQRSRAVIDFAGRSVVGDHLELGEWRIPRGYNVLVSIHLLHDDSRQFSDPERFDPERFLGHPPSAAWLPFGGGTRRCIGAAFAHMEMDVVLRCLLREFTLLPTDAPDEAWHSRGVAFAPRRGGQITLRRR